MSPSLPRDADAVRYIILQKLASGLRHSVMGELQGIQFLAELGARLSATGADQSRLRDCVGKIPAAAGEAIATCQSIIEWLRPEEGASATLADVVGQCVKLAGDDWRLRGIRATVELPDAAGQARVAKGAARELVAASLLTMTDLQPGPLDIEIVGALDGETVELRIRGRISTRTVHVLPPPPRTELAWDDVAVLAAAHREGFSAERAMCTLRFASIPPTSETPASGAGRVLR